jgi:hypothetical protein
VTIRAFSHLETSPVVIKACHRCATAIFTGLAEGVHAYVDVTPINTIGEIAVVLDGRQTYTLRRSGLVQRDATRRSDPGLTGPIVAEHRCGRSP